MRPIDADEYERELLYDIALHGEQLSGDAAYNRALVILTQMPTLTPPNKWVSVEERMPEEEHLVLAYSKMFGAAVAMLYSGSWYGYNGEEGDYCSPYLYVTHWMHLPAPPGTSLSSG